MTHNHAKIYNEAFKKLKKFFYLYTTLHKKVYEQ